MSRPSQALQRGGTRSHHLICRRALDLNLGRRALELLERTADAGLPLVLADVRRHEEKSRDLVGLPDVHRNLLRSTSLKKTLAKPEPSTNDSTAGGISQ